VTHLDCSVDVWSTVTNHKVVTFRYPFAGDIIDAAFSAQAKYLSLAYSQGTIIRFDIASGKGCIQAQWRLKASPIANQDTMAVSQNSAI